MTDKEKIYLLNCGGVEFRHDSTLPESQKEDMWEFITKGWELGILNPRMGDYVCMELWWVNGALRGAPE